MSIHRSGVNTRVQVICLLDINIEGTILKSGQKYELLHDLGSMYVLNIEGKEVVVPKDAFKDA